MSERTLGNYCPSPTLRPRFSAELHQDGTATSIAGVDHEGRRFGSQEAQRLLELKVCPPLYFTFDETGRAATLHVEWHGMRFSRCSKISRMRQDLEQFAPDLLSDFEDAYASVQGCFVTDAIPLTAEEVENAEQGL